MTCALIVNRDSVQREAIIDALEAEGINSLGARSDQHAVVLLAHASPALIVWDWPAGEMPPEVFLAIARQGGFHGPLVVCSDTFDLDGVPYDLLLRKPFEVGQLVSAIERLVVLVCGDHPRTETCAGKDASFTYPEEGCDD